MKPDVTKRVIEQLQRVKANHSCCYYYRGYHYAYTTQSTTEPVADTAGAGSNGHHLTVSRLKALINDPNKKN